MSREDDVKTLSAGLHEFSTGNEWETLGVAAAIAAFVDARIWKAMKPSEVARLEHRPECASWNMSHAGGMQMAATPCNCDLYKRMVAPVQPEATAAKTLPLESHKPTCSRVNGPMELPAYILLSTGACTECGARVSEPREPTETGANVSRSMQRRVAIQRGEPPPSFDQPPAAKTSETACSCREIQAADPSRHFKGCARRVEFAPCGICLQMGHATADCPQRTPPAAKPPEPSKPAAVGPEPPERVTLVLLPRDQGIALDGKGIPGDWVRVRYVRASAHNRAVEMLRSAVERWPSYNVRDDVVAFLRAHDAPPPRHPADKHGNCTQCGGASHDGAC